MRMDTTACHPGRLVETFFCTTDMRDFFLIYSDAFTLSGSDPFSLSLGVSIASPEATFETAVVIDIFTGFQGPEFDTELFNIQVKFEACCQIVSYRIVSRLKQ